MKYNMPPFNEEEKREYFEEKILNFSKNIFLSPKLGLLLVFSFDILYIYLMLKSRSVFSIIFYIFLVYLLLSILFAHNFNIQKSA